ncbi:MAG TPA: cell division protein FtsZ [Prolixibacteraceae bacterium]|mgnify:CR=1 FL=1|nr:cell division protein FtsZ [Prolixibacteraceae bacterium]HPS13012.1 cell division protein FtsZ [Prolixibacteraceae bacterium]
MAELLNFNCDTNLTSNIKVIGVGGGGGNAVNYMFRRGITDVGFIVCNTDAQALKNSPVPVAIQLGETLTMGRGAGNMPELGEQAAIESIDEVKAVLENTNMVFITAGMGGGTGTGAAPVIAKACREMNILTIAVVTVPSQSEGRKRYQQAIQGVEKIREHVDSLLVINNEKIREIFGNLPATQAFSKADEILATAVKGVAEIITLHGNINIDFADVHTVMSGSKVFIMGTGFAEGDDRALVATKKALESPLLDSNDIYGTHDILLNITSGKDEITIGEIGEIIEYLQKAAGSDANIIWGNGYDPELNKQISVTIIATGFKVNPSAIMQEYEKEPNEVFELKPEKEPVSERREPVFERRDPVYEVNEPVFEVSQPIRDDEMETVEIDLTTETIKRNHNSRPTSVNEPVKMKEKEKERAKPKESKVDNWFMRQFNNLFEENSSDFD